MNSKTSKLITALISLILLIYVGVQAYNWLYDPYQTEIVLKDTYLREIELNGFFIRDENILESSSDGVVSYNYKNAQKVSKGATVAGIYENNTDLQNFSKLDALKEKRAALVQAQNKEAIEGIQIDLLNTRILNGRMNLIKLIDENNFTDIDDVYNDLLLNINLMNVSTGSEVSFDETINEIDSKIKEIEESVSKKKETVVSKHSGYFSSSTDGYESVFTLDMLEDLSVDKVNECINNKTILQSNSIGKIVSENEWYFISTVSKKDAELLKSFKEQKKQLTLKFNSISTREVIADVTDLIFEKDADIGVVVFKSFYYDEDIINMRFESPKAVVASYMGIVISKDAIRVHDEIITDDEGNEVTEKVSGVYTLLGKTVKFKKIDPIYSDDYVVISKPNVSQNYVSVYDEVIIKGKGLSESSK